MREMLKMQMLKWGRRLTLALIGVFIGILILWILVLIKGGIEAHNAPPLLPSDPFYKVLKK